MQNPTREAPVHLRDDGPSGRWLGHAFVALLPVLACFLGGATQKWAEGIVVALLGLFLMSQPPRFSLGPAINPVLLALLIWSATALLPPSGFYRSPGRASLLNAFRICVPPKLR